MSTYTLKQVMYPCDQPWTEIFYDGEAKVVDNLVTVHRAEHRDTLIVKGFVEVLDMETPKEVSIVESSEGRFSMEETDSVEQAEFDLIITEEVLEEDHVVQKDEEEIPKEALTLEASERSSKVKPRPQSKPKSRKKAGAQA
jgi:hypothetical protein